MLAGQLVSQCDMCDTPSVGVIREGVGTMEKEAAGREKRGEMPYKGGWLFGLPLIFLPSWVIFPPFRGLLVQISGGGPGATV